MRFDWWKICFVCSLFTVSTCLSVARAQEVSWIEKFALSSNRTEVLSELIPGSEDYYYYWCLHYQSTEQWNKADETLRAYVDRYQWTPRAVEIQNRQALLTYNQNPKATLELLQQRLNLQFNHQRPRREDQPDLPTALDETTLDRQALTERALAQFPGTLQGFEPSSFDWLIQRELTPEQRRHLLQRLERPDYPNLVQLVVDDLNHKDTAGFGQFEIHRRLLLTQLEQCMKLKPELRNDTNFDHTYLLRLQPSNDLNVRSDNSEQRAYLERLWSFVATLEPAHNSLKAHVLYHRLVLDRKLDEYDEERFLEYLKLPKHASYVRAEYMQPIDRQQHAVNLQQNFVSLTQLPPPQDDEPLVRSYLLHFLAAADDYSTFAPYVNDIYLKHLFAEAKIINGLGDAEKWFSLLPAAKYQELKDRVDIDFTYTNKTQFNADDPVSIDVYVKNVEKLIVKVFEINTTAYLRQNLRPIGADIDLDGLVAQEEASHRFEESPLRRVLRHLEFPELNRPGVFVIELIGSGKASRALIFKGRLHHVVRSGVSGHVFHVFNEENELQKDASLWLAGTLYKSDEDGAITVPYSNQPGQQAVVLTAGGLSTLAHFQQENESYSLQAGIYVDREELIAHRKAHVIVRPQLLLNGFPVTLQPLEDVRLRITSTDLDGVSSTMDVPNFELFEDRESVHEFQVPQRLANLQFQLAARIDVPSQNAKVELSADQSFAINDIDRTEKTDDLHLTRLDTGYVVDLLGKTGEAKADRIVNFSIKLRDFTQPVPVSLQTDAAGRIRLGKLAAVASIKAVSPQGVEQNWTLEEDHYSYRQTIHAVAGEKVRIPYMGQDSEPDRSRISLLELRGDQFTADRFANVSLANGMIVLDDLPPGDYSLLLKTDDVSIRVRVVEGKRERRFALGPHRKLEIQSPEPLQISAVEMTAEQLQVKLLHATKTTRVHVFATRFEPLVSPYSLLSKVPLTEPRIMLQQVAEAQYLTSRDIGDEFRYILERRTKPKYPGNMLERPSLLLNPWSIRSTETDIEVPSAADPVPADAAAPENMERGQVAAESRVAHQPSGFSNLDFLAWSSLVSANVVPDEHGLITIEREELRNHQLVVVVAVDPLNTVSRTIALSEIAPKYRDLRLVSKLDPKQHYQQKREVAVLRPGEQLVLADLSSSRMAIYDTIGKVHNLYSALHPDTKLHEFGFLGRWLKLSAEQKREMYEKYAGHELHLFLYHHDREFFDCAIRPYLANKKDQTFIDSWLLDDDVSEFQQSWKFQQLNTLERILLGQRVPDESSAIQRLIKDQFDLLPPDPQRQERNFLTAVKGGALDPTDLAHVQQQVELKDDRLLDLKSLGDQQEEAMGLAAGLAGGAEQDPPAPIEDAAKLNLAARDRLSDRADSSFFEWDRESRKEMRQYYRKLEKTMELVESNYYQLPDKQQSPALLPINAFWNDLATHQADGEFLPRSIAEPTANYHEMLLALALLDLPFDAEAHENKLEGQQLTITPASPMLVFLERIQQAENVAEKSSILLSQNYFRYGDRYRHENGQQIDKFISEEFVIDLAYGCNVVVANPTSSRKKLDLLLQIPNGALPVAGAQRTRSVHVELEPYHAQTIEYHFYFPAPGKYSHYPVQVASGDEVVAHAEPFSFNVVSKPTSIDTTSWAYIAQYGSNDQVIDFLRENRIVDISFEQVAWRLDDEKFFEQLTNLLSARHVYSHTVWSYSIKHNRPAEIREFLRFAGDFIGQTGEYLESPLLVIDPVERRTYEHMEYRPLINARVNQLGRERKILNDRFFQQYSRLLKILSYRRQLDHEELLSVTYYLLLQDRIEEAIDTFARVQRSALQTTLQYDYCKAYLHFSQAEPEQAKQIALQYANYPVDRWRKAFENVVNQANEIESGEVTLADGEDRTQQQTALAAKTPVVDFSIEGEKLQLTYQNLEQVQINYYLMDVELLFSQNPFVKGESQRFSSVVPNKSQSLRLPANKNVLTVALPEELMRSNVLVEIVGEGVSASQPYYPNSMNVQLIENYGQLRVTSTTGEVLPKTYVKVYARNQDSTISFYKDGYTDLRGRFDYSSLSTDDLDRAKRFSVLILSDEHGAVVREVSPPRQ